MFFKKEDEGGNKPNEINFCLSPVLKYLWHFFLSVLLPSADHMPGMVVLSKVPVFT